MGRGGGLQPPPPFLGSLSCPAGPRATEWETEAREAVGRGRGVGKAESRGGFKAPGLTLTPRRPPQAAQLVEGMGIVPCLPQLCPGGPAAPQGPCWNHLTMPTPLLEMNSDAVPPSNDPPIHSSPHPRERFPAAWPSVQHPPHTHIPILLSLMPVLTSVHPPALHLLLSMHPPTCPCTHPPTHSLTFPWTARTVSSPSCSHLALWPPVHPLTHGSQLGQPWRGSRLCPSPHPIFHAPRAPLQPSDPVHQPP